MCSAQLAACQAQASRADVALGLAKSLVQQKLLFLPLHEVGIVFFGTVGTSNALQADGYEHITVAYDGALRAPDLAMVEFLAQQPKGGAESDSVNGLIVAMDLLMTRTRDMRCGRSIFLITDNASTSFGDEDLDNCLSRLAAWSITLFVTDLGGAADVGPWMHYAATCPAVQLLSGPALARQSNLSVKPVRVQPKVRLSLTISPAFEIPVGIYSRTTRVSFPTLKQRSKLAAGMPGDGHPGPDGVIQERTYHVADDPDGAEVVAEDRIKGHRYGQSIVPMSEYDEAALMYTCDRTLTALGFAGAATVGPENSMYHVDAVFADRGDTWASCAFESLVAAMVAEDVVLIARYAPRKNAQPRMVALVPRAAAPDQAAAMELQFLPFFEDIREWTCRSLATPSAEQRSATAALVEAMTLDAGEKPLGEPSKQSHEAFRPEETNNPALARFYSFVVQRAISSTAKVPPADQDGWNHVQLPSKVAEHLAANKVAETLKSKFGLEKVEKAQTRRKHFWREAIAEKRKGLELGEVDTKRVKVPERKKEEKEEDEDKVKGEGSHEPGIVPGMAAPVGPAPVGPAPVVHVGSVHPERDFEKWLAHKAGGHDVVAEAVRQMCAVIERLADEGDDFHAKAVGCLTALRCGCVQEGEAAAFNHFARVLSMAVAPRRSRFWQRAREAHLGLITDAEVPTSTVTAEEAAAFLRGETYVPHSASSSVPKPAAASAAAAALTEQDLEAMMD